MSYPLTIHCLVIEDEDAVKDAYERMFEKIAEDTSEFPFSIAPACFAFSYREATEYLNGSKFFHLVILDLRLPENPKMPATEVELGLKLLSQSATRDRYPIPALLVISAHIGSTDQTRMQDTLSRGFYYGRSCVKSDFALLEGEIRRACKEALRYSAVGFHIRDAGVNRYPTVSPRDEDLLRRSALQQLGAIGLDLEWWSATPRVGQTPSANHWTKVLMGRYLLDSGRGASRPYFFKLIDGSDSSSVIDSACKVELKLPHIKLSAHVIAKSTALIVTEKAGPDNARPQPLDTVFKNCSTDQVREVASQIAIQIEQLGELLPESKQLSALFWPYHDMNNLREQWTRFATQIQAQLGEDLDPILMYSKLVASNQRLRIKERSVVHGDLHMKNVAIDNGPGGPRAYIFDPGVSTRNVAGRDLAVLEVSTILHQPINAAEFKQICSRLYAVGGPRMDDSGMDDVSKRIVAFVEQLRTLATAWNDLRVYAVLVFDFALIQLGGLAFGTSGNKIADPFFGAYLVGAVARWCQELWFSTAMPPAQQS
jgi:CheY-like chemotaxis protein